LQVHVSSGNELSIAGAPTELTSELAVITQEQDAEDKDLSTVPSRRVERHEERRREGELCTAVAVK